MLAGQAALEMRDKGRQIAARPVIICHPIPFAPAEPCDRVPREVARVETLYSRLDPYEVISYSGRQDHPVGRQRCGLRGSNGRAAGICQGLHPLPVAGIHCRNNALNRVTPGEHTHAENGLGTAGEMTPDEAVPEIRYGQRVSSPRMGEGTVVGRQDNGLVRVCFDSDNIERDVALSELGIILPPSTISRETSPRDKINHAFVWNILVIIVGVGIALIGLYNGATGEGRDSAFRQTVAALWVIQGCLGC